MANEFKRISPSDSKKPIIDRMAEADAYNFRRSRQFLDQTTLLCQDIVDLYKEVGRTLSSPGASISEQLAMAMGAMCQHHLVSACISVMQGRITDGFMQTRQAIEACAMARICLNDSSAANIWLNTPITDRKPLRKKFSTASLFPSNHSVLAELGGRYDFCSTQTHASLFSMVRNMVNRDDTAPPMFLHLELHDPGDLPHAFLWTIDTHSLMLNIFEEMLADRLSAKSVKSIQELRERIERHKAKWFPAIQARYDWMKSRLKKQQP